MEEQVILCALLLFSVTENLVSGDDIFLLTKQDFFYDSREQLLWSCCVTGTGMHKNLKVPPRRNTVTIRNDRNKYFGIWYKKS